MTRSKKGRRKCHSCAPGCKCEWCMSGVKRRAVRQAPMPHSPADEISLAELLVIDVEVSEAGMARIQELLVDPPEPLPGLIEAVKRWRKA